MKKNLFGIIFSFITLFSFSQDLDSLLNIAKATKNDSIKLITYNKVAFGYIFNNPKKAIKIIEEGKMLAEEAKFNYGLTKLTNTQGIYMDVTGQSDSAKYYFEKALKMSQENNFKTIESKCINNLGMFNWNKGNYNEALDYFFKSLKMEEKYGDERNTDASLNNIGLIYQEMKLNEKALEYHKKALHVREKYNLENAQVSSLNNIGINLKELGRIDEAILTYEKGIELAKLKDNLMVFYLLLDNLGNAYYLKGNYRLALKTYLKALDRPESFSGDKKSLLSIYNNIATLYNEIGQPKNAMSYVNKGFALIKEYPDIETVTSELYLTGAESHYMTGDFESARTLKKKFITINESIFSETNAEKIADLEIKYETEKKERKILLQRAKIAESDIVIQKRNYQVYGLLGLTLLLCLLGYLFYNQQKLKNTQLKKENELKDALLKIETQNKLQEQRLRISRDLHDNIGAQLTFIISSIDNLKYGFDISDKNLNSKLDAISEFTSGTIYELRDTIWAMNKNKITFEDLQSRISNYIDKANIAAHNIKFQFVIDDSVETNTTFSSIHGMNIYRIIQEAINNSIKYAKASNIMVEVSKVVSNLRFKISDNGMGFNDKEVKLGNGILNMKKRTSEIDGELIIESKLKDGTNIILTI